VPDEHQAETTGFRLSSRWGSLRGSRPWRMEKTGREQKSGRQRGRRNYRF